jgi:hypothetical protein
MSLDVSPATLAAAQRGELDDPQFVAVVRDSLPYAWEVISAAVDDQGPGKPFGVHEVPPPSEQARGQLLRALASNAIRGVLERHFGVALAFQNCHSVAAFAPSSVQGSAYQAFISPRNQILNQRPELRDC